MLKKFKDRFPNWVLNRYSLIGLVFVVWMVFLDDNSFLFHKSLDKEIQELEGTKDYYQQEIEKDKAIIQELDSSDQAVERIAREEYRMKKQNEDVYIITDKTEENE